jgi:predicted nucleic acid-binding protein
MAAVVSDTTSLIALAGQGRLDLLGACFEQVLRPDAVYAEWLAGDASLSQALQHSPFLQVVAVTDRVLLAELELLLDRGEAEALTLAKIRSLPLLVEEKKGTRHRPDDGCPGTRPGRIPDPCGGARAPSGT